MIKPTLILLVLYIFICCTNNKTKPLKEKNDFHFKEDIFISIYVVNGSKDTFRVFEKNVDAIFLEITKDKEIRNYHLKHTYSKNGEKYTNDKGYIFWTKGNRFSWIFQDSIIASGQRIFKESIK